MKHVATVIHGVIGLLALVVLAMIASSVMARCTPASTGSVEQHDAGIKSAIAHREAARVIADSIDKTVVRPAYHRDSVARQLLRTVLAADTLVPLDVDSLKAALQVTAAAATQLDVTSEKTIGGLVALVAAKTAEASAADTVASRATSALDEERRDRNRERWIYRAKIAGGLLLGITVGVIAHSI